MKIKQIFILLIIISSTLFAKGVNRQEVADFVSGWLSNNQYALHYGIYKNSEEDFVLKNIIPIYSNGIVVYYVAELEPRGFIIIAKDNRLNPVIGYSTEMDFSYDNAEDDFFLNDIIADLNANLLRMEKLKISVVNNLWESGSNNFINGTEGLYGPYLQSDWGQAYVNGSPVYNYYTPNRWPAGCVATATAQILNYYKWPYQGYGSHGYYDDGKYHYANFGKTFYDWANILDLYTDQYFTTDNQEAVGLLVYHCAVALNMDFGADGSTSSTSDVPGILHSYFRASGHYKSKSSTGFWTAMQNNMKDARPAIISIKSSEFSTGHAAVVDGYFETNNYYHVNPGWYGNNIGWYNISGDWNMGGYNIVIGAVKGIVPSPQIMDMEKTSENSFKVIWKTSRYQNADYYELQQARSSSGPWKTLSAHITDSTYQINNAELGSYYYKVRAYRDGIWWDFSKIKKIQLGTERAVTFRVDMTYHPLGEKDTLVIRGNIPPLAGNVNSVPMEKIDATNVYKLNINFDYDYVGQTLIYRFFIQSKNNLVAEKKNREYTITAEPSQILPVVFFDDYVSVEKNDKLPVEFNLEQNYPNPFNPVTTINYSVPSMGTSRMLSVPVTLKVYDLLGKEIATLVSKVQTEGNYSVNFNAENLPSGIYLYKLNAGIKVKTKKMILIK